MTVATDVGHAPEMIPDEGRFLFEDADWGFYQRTLEQLHRAGQHARITYDQGRMEIMTVTRKHEIIKLAIGRLLEAYANEMRMEIEGVGNVTCRREDLSKGLEPDECYYVSSVYRDTGVDELDLAINPPPDVAVEVEVSRTSLSRQPIYAALGIPELWRYDGTHIVAMELREGQYVAVQQSRFFPKLDLEMFSRFVSKAIMNQRKTVLEFIDEIRKQQL